MTQYDLILRGGTIYDGSGGAPVVGDVAIQGQQIAALGDLSAATADRILDVSGLAVAPGFINMLSWAGVTLMMDGRSQSDIRQGVTLEVVGEGWSEGPLNEQALSFPLSRMGDFQYERPWTTLGGYLDHMAQRGISTNLASFVGDITLRLNTIGMANRHTTEAELDEMRRLTRQAMEDGAVGLSTALIYPPDAYSSTDEIVAVAQIVAEYGGLYISHIRNESQNLLAALDELISIARQANVRAEVYHLKAAGEVNWPKMEPAIARIEAARAAGLDVTADMYPYPASSTGLAACIPPWVHEGGFNELLARLQDPAARQRIAAEMRTPSNAWDNLYIEAGSPENIVPVSFYHEELRRYVGKSLAEISAQRGQDPVETLFDLLIAEQDDISAVYFSMSEDNLRLQLRQPWVSIGSDGESSAPDEQFAKMGGTHPRAYGSFARVLGKYVRQEQVLSLAEAVRRLTSLPAHNLRIDQSRGWLKPGYQADLAIFDPETIIDRATFEDSRQYAVGMRHVFVNGTQVLADGEHTGALPGQIVRGPGWKK